MHDNPLAMPGCFRKIWTITSRRGVSDTVVPADGTTDRGVYRRLAGPARHVRNA